MPGVSVLAPSSTLTLVGGLASPKSVSLSGGKAMPANIIDQIRSQAKELVERKKNLTGLQYIREAGEYFDLACQKEAEGDLRSAYRTFLTSATLSRRVFDSPEYRLEAQHGKGDEVRRQFQDFQKASHRLHWFTNEIGFGGEKKESRENAGCELPRPGKPRPAYYEYRKITPPASFFQRTVKYGSQMIARVNQAEARLREAEEMNQVSSPKSPDSPNGVRTDGPKSIADRMRALENAGMHVHTTRRPRESPQPSPGLPQTPLSQFSSRSSNAGAGPSSPRAAAATSSSSAVPGNISPHAFVAPSSFGPPSPTSSTSSLPDAHHHQQQQQQQQDYSSLSVSESTFSQAYPSIDELDERMKSPEIFPAVPSNPLPSLPSVPKTQVGSSTRGSLPPPPTMPREFRRDGDRPLPSTARAFPHLPMDPTIRPASTPLHAVNRPPSPPGSPLQATSPLQASSPISARPLPIPPQPVQHATPQQPVHKLILEKADLPIASSVTPKVLKGYLGRADIRLLLLDVRTRDEFDQGRIKADAIVCLEPTILVRKDVTAASIHDAIVLSPRQEQILFSNRDKFDLVVMYDASSESATPVITTLSTAIFERENAKPLRRPPVLLVGGIKAWQQEFGEEIKRGPTDDGSAGVGGSSTRTNGVNGLPSPLKTDNVAISTRTRSSTQNSGRQPSALSRQNTGYSVESVRSPTENSFAPDLPPRATMTRIQPTSLVSASSQARSHDGIFIPSQASTSGSSTSVSHPPISYPSMSRAMSPLISHSTGNASFGHVNGTIGVYPSPPPQASINPSPLSRRRSDYLEQSQQPYSGITNRQSIDYPDLSSQHILRPPPAAASPASERQDSRPRFTPTVVSSPKPPTIQSEFPPTYWVDTQITTSGIKNLGNTCYMNSTIQCLSAIAPFARFFIDGRWKSAVNMINPLGSKGKMTSAFAAILHEMRHAEQTYLTPYGFRKSICTVGSQFAGAEQHDSQEFLNFLLDGLHEDLNRVLKKPNFTPDPEKEAELERLPLPVAAEQEWSIYRMRNDSLIVDFFQGQFRNRMECLTCGKTSTTYNSFMYLTLPIPTSKGVSKVSLRQCLDAFVKAEVMEASDAWNCPKCKTLRKATKQLSLSRLPPVLLIHFKRFSFKGPFTDKLETFVDYPKKDLDLTSYMPPPLPPALSKSQVPARSTHDDPSAQVPPYKYDLFAVTNHFGTLSSGHYTAFIASRGGWLYCDDSRVTTAEAAEVVGKPAYVLYYKRVN